MTPAVLLHRLILCLALMSSVVSAQEVQQTFRIQPLRPVSELRADALKAQPPVEQGDFLEHF